MEGDKFCDQIGKKKSTKISPFFQRILAISPDISRFYHLFKNLRDFNDQKKFYSALRGEKKTNYFPHNFNEPNQIFPSEVCMWKSPPPPCVACTLCLQCPYQLCY